MSNPLLTKKSFDFLKQLENNNDRDWFKSNKATYDASRENMLEVVQAVLTKLQAIDSISTPSAKKSLYRIYRDVRFSKDKSPYKTYYSGYFGRATAQLRGGYYLSVHPGNRSLLGGGFWNPNKEDLLHIRQQIALDEEPLRKVLASKAFKSAFGSLEGEQLKTAPKGFDKAHPSIDLLRYKQYLVSATLKDSEILSSSYVDKVIENYKAVRPFFDVMSMYLTTDLNGDERS
jgi:uncharacterized protein (TIGR02453 family)